MLVTTCDWAYGCWLHSAAMHSTISLFNLLISLKNCLLKCKKEMKIRRREKCREPPHLYMKLDLCGYTPHMKIVYLVLITKGAVLLDSLHTF